MLKRCLWTITLPWIVLSQTYYMNFIFNNYRYVDRERKEVHTDGKNYTKNMTIEEETLEINSIESETLEITSKQISPKPGVSYEDWPSLESHESELSASNTDEDDKADEVDTVDNIVEIIHNNGKPKKTTTITTERLTTKRHITKHTTREPTTEEPMIKYPTTELKTVTPHPPEFFHYPGAKCHEELDLHELFGISLERDRGLPSKVFCDFNNDWGGPWYLMTRIELPSRVHMRHWFFGYLTDDYNDMNINFISLAHIMNSMRIAMLIIGQDNNDKLVYNLYDDVVISGFNDLFMLRKAQLVEANTTDLLFVSVGDVINTFSGRNRSCPFHVMGGWWGFNTWRPTSQYFCVFPVDRDIKRPGFIAIFIKPSPFAVNNTALYENVITTRRPWVPTVDAILMEQANHDQKVYHQLRNEEFQDTKRAALAELGRRSQIFRDFDKNRIMDNGQPLGTT
ncbi:GL19535 [Drosophila persimilis]|uniref:GL19535 n=1 Tax=Drosophila persimilis TaxID=7234 RepID=B4G9S4_DROPE|nr:GL19535 [Drosophila persimilis]